VKEEYQGRGEKRKGQKQETKEGRKMMKEGKERNERRYVLALAQHSEA
jgi:hypothetical protein